MSEIRVDTITEKTSGSGTTVSNLKNPNSPFRNIIINGDMSIAQRGTSQASITAAGYYSCDRWRYSTGTAGLGAFTMSQSTDVPGLGFTTSTKLDNTTADASPSANEGVFLAQRIEGKNLQNIGKGTSDAKQLTLSFHVKTTKTGTYQVNLYDLDNTRIVGQTYVVSDTNWNKYTITFPADTTGAFTNDANLSLQLEFWLAAGSNYNSGAVPTSWEGGTNADRAAGLTVNLADNTSNDWYITGVQIEVGETATDFEHLPHDVNLERCQRYCTVFGTDDAYSPFGSGMWKTDTVASLILTFPTKMNHEPTMTIANATASHLRKEGTAPNTSAIALDVSSTQACMYNGTVSSGGSAGQGTVHFGDSTTNQKLTFDSEL